MNKFRHVLFRFMTLGLICCPTAMFAREYDNQLWTMATVTKPLDHNQSYLIYGELQPRFSDNVKRTSTTLVRTAIGRRLSSNNSVWLGYAWTPLISPEFRNEHRVFQQLLFNQANRFMHFQNRTRLEERFIEDTKHDASVRFRNLSRFTKSIYNSEAWSWVIYDEVFININSVSNGPQGGFDQNRWFMGLNHKIERQQQVEFGYMANYISRPNRSNLWNHVLLVAFNIT